MKYKYLHWKIEESDCTIEYLEGVNSNWAYKKYTFHDFISQHHTKSHPPTWMKYNYGCCGTLYGAPWGNASIIKGYDDYASFLKDWFHIIINCEEKTIGP